MADENNAQAADESDNGALAQGGADADPNPPQRTEVETLAMEMGWNPDYRPTNGKQARTAHDWIKSTNQRNKSLTRQMDAMQQTLDRSVAAMDKAAKRETEAAVAEIQRRFDEAVDAKDTAAAAKAANDMRKLETDSQQPAPRNDDAVAQFKRDNPWFEDDDEATAYAVAQSNLLQSRGVTDPGKQLEEVGKRVRKRFPELFPDGNDDGEQRREQPKTLSLGTPSRGSSQRKAEGFGDMPEVAKAAAGRVYEAMKMRNGDKTPDRKAFETQYAKDYFAA